MEFCVLSRDGQVTDAKITIYTTRPDTIFGATYSVLAPEHPLLTFVVSEAQQNFVEEYKDGKRDAVVAYIRNAKQNWGTGVSTLCNFYNATGESLLFAQEDSWCGQIHGSYPVKVQNGQWGAFLHVKTTAVASGSVGFVVYRVRYNDADFCKQVLCWQTLWGQVRHNNQAYCDIFDDCAIINPKDIYDEMARKDTRNESTMEKGMFTTATIETGTSPLYEAQFTIDDAAVSKTSYEEVEATPA